MSNEFVMIPVPPKTNEIKLTRKQVLSEILPTWDLTAVQIGYRARAEAIGEDNERLTRENIQLFEDSQAREHNDKIEIDRLKRIAQDYKQRLKKAPDRRTPIEKLTMEERLERDLCRGRHTSLIDAITVIIKDFELYMQRLINMNAAVITHELTDIVKTLEHSKVSEKKKCLMTGFYTWIDDLNKFTMECVNCNDNLDYARNV